MPVIVGSDGAVQFDFGGGLTYVANVFAWSVNLGRETLPTTKQGDEAVTRTGGLADHTGSVSMRLRFAEDGAEALSAWQLINFALGNTDDALKASIKLFIQTAGVSADCEDITGLLIQDPISLTGTVVIASISLDCTDPGEPVVAVASWEADGALTLTRDTP